MAGAASRKLLNGGGEESDQPNVRQWNRIGGWLGSTACVVLPSCVEAAE
jgi:hypothetical protein